MGPLLLASPPEGIADALLCVLSLSACCRCRRCWVDDIPRAAITSLDRSCSAATYQLLEDVQLLQRNLNERAHVYRRARERYTAAAGGSQFPDPARDRRPR